MSLVAGWNYNEVSGAVTDVSGNGNGFALTGTSTRTAAGGGYTYGGARPNNKGLMQTSAQVQLGPATVTPFNTPSRTICTWIKGALAVPSWVLEGYVGGSGTGAFGWLMLSSVFRARAKNSSNTIFEATGTAPDTNFRFMAITHDGANLKSYCDNGSGGITLLQTTAMASAVWDMTELRIFDASGSNVVLSDTRLYNNALDSTALTSLLTTPLDSPAAPFVGWGVPV